MYSGYRVGAIIPALNEEQAISLVIDGLHSLKNPDDTATLDEIIVADNGSEDRTSALARAHGATVVTEPQRGYGRACLSGLEKLTESNPDIVIFIDGDNAFDTSVIPSFLDEIVRGEDLVIGSRTKGEMDPGAMTLSQVFGNRLATFLISWLWHVSISDLGPLRAIRTTALDKLHMQDESFGWTTEMQVKAVQHGLRIVEIPVNTRVRLGESKISGTLSGVIGAGYGILSTIFKLRMQQSRLLRPSLRNLKQE